MPRYLAVDYLRNHEQNQRKKRLSLQRNDLEITNEGFFATLGKQTSSHSKLSLHDLDPELLDQAITDDLLNNTMQEGYEVHEISLDSSSPDVADEVYDDFQFQYFLQQVQTAKKHTKMNTINQKAKCLQSSKMHQLKTKNVPKPEEREIHLAKIKINNILFDTINDLVDADEALEHTKNKCTQTLDKGLQVELHEFVQSPNVGARECSVTCDEAEVSSNKDIFCDTSASSEEFDFVVIDAVEDSESNEDSTAECNVGKLLADRCPSKSTKMDDAIVNHNDDAVVTEVDVSDLEVLVPDLVNASNDKCSQNEKDLAIATLNNSVGLDTVNSKNQLSIDSSDDDVYVVGELIDVVNEGDERQDSEILANVASKDPNKKDTDDHSTAVEINVVCIEDETNGELSQDAGNLKMDRQLNPRIIDIVCLPSDDDDDDGSGADKNIRDDIPKFIQVASVEIPISLAEEMLDQCISDDEDDNDGDDPYATSSKAETNSNGAKVCGPFVEDANASICEGKELSFNKKVATDKVELASGNKTIDAIRLYCTQGAEALKSSTEQMKRNIQFDSPLDNLDIISEGVNGKTVILRSNNIHVDATNTIIATIADDNDNENALKSDDNIKVDSKSCSAEIVSRNEPARSDDKDQDRVSSGSPSLKNENLEVNREINLNSDSHSLKPSWCLSPAPSSLPPPSISSSSILIIQGEGEKSCKNNDQLPERLRGEIKGTNASCKDNPVVDAMDLSLPNLFNLRTETIENTDSIVFKQCLKNLSDLGTNNSPKVTDVPVIDVVNGNLKGCSKFHFVEKVLKSPLTKTCHVSSLNVKDVNDVTCASKNDLPSYTLAPLVLITKSLTKTSDTSLSSVPALNNKAVVVTESSLVKPGGNNKLPVQFKIGENSGNNNNNINNSNTSMIRRFVKFKDDYDPVETFFNLRKKSSNCASTTTSSVPQSSTNAPRPMPSESSEILPIRATSTVQTPTKATSNVKLSINSGIISDSAAQHSKECNIALSASSGNVAVVTPSFNMQGSNATKETSFSPSKLVELPKQRGPFTITCDILEVPLTEEYAKLVTALGHESESSMSLLKSHKALKEDQFVEDLTPEATRFIAKQFDNYARNNSEDITELLKASAVLHLIVSVLRSLVNCCLPSAANQLKVMADRNRTIVGDSLDDAVGCLCEISDRYKEAGVVHPKVLKLLEVLKDYFQRQKTYGQDDIKKAVIVVETDYAASLGAHLCECIGSTVKGSRVAFFVPLVRANELHKTAEELKERLSSLTILISTPAIVPAVNTLIKVSDVHLFLIEYSHSNDISFSIGPDEVLESKFECVALMCRHVIQSEKLVEKKMDLEDRCLSLRDVLVEQNSYTLITSQEFIKLPDVLCSLEAKYKITLVERSYPKTNFNEHYCDLLVDHESGLLVDDISSLADEKAVDGMLVRVTRLRSRLSRCWVVFYNFNSSHLTTKLVTNYYSLVSIGAVVSNKCTGYEIKFLCCKSVECIPQLVRHIADLSFKKSLSTFEDASKEKWLNRSFITPDPTKHEMILIAFPCFNSMSAQMLLESNGLKLLMSSSLVELQNAYPMIDSRFLKVFIKLRQSTSPVYRQLKENDGCFVDSRLESDSTYFPKHSVDKEMNDRNDATTVSIGDATFFDLADVDNIGTNDETNMFVMRMKGVGDSDDMFEGSERFGTKTSGGFYQLRASSQAHSGSRWNNDGGCIPSTGRKSVHPTSILSQDHFDYHDRIALGKRDYFDEKQNYFQNQEDKEESGLAIFRRGRNESETYCKEDFSSALPFYADHRPPSRHDFDWLVHAMDEEDERYCPSRDSCGRTSTEGFQGYESPSYSLYEDPVKCDEPSSSNKKWGIGRDKFKPCPSSNRVNSSYHDGWRASNDIRSNMRQGHQKDYRTSERKRKLTFELDDSMRNGQTRLKFI